MSFHNTWHAIFFRVRNHFFWLGEYNDKFILGVTVLGVTRKNVTSWTIFGIPWTKEQKWLFFGSV